MIRLIGAYGRVYKDGAEAKIDWEAGVDFKIQGGPYCSIRDLKALKEMGSLSILTTKGFHTIYTTKLDEVLG